MDAPFQGRPTHCIRALSLEARSMLIGDAVANPPIQRWLPGWALPGKDGRVGEGVSSMRSGTSLYRREIQE
eukprot:414327-Pyramimonas_sp.AAC.1